MIAELFRTLGDFKGKQRLARLLLRKEIATLRDVVVQSKNGCSFKLPNIIETIGFELYINGIFEKDIISLIIARLAPSGQFIDLGANIGSISIPVCKLRPDVRVLAVEASPKVFSYLRFNTGLNEVNNCTTVNRAVAAEDNLKVEFFNPLDKFGKGSMANVYKSTVDVIDTATLDTLAKDHGFWNADLIKVDIEGYEYFAFAGGSGLLGKPDAPDIIFEFIGWSEESTGTQKAGDAQKLLMDYGYTLYSVLDNKLTRLNSALTSGDAMLLATKRNI